MKGFLKIFGKSLQKDWPKIFRAWAWIYSYVRKYWPKILVYTFLSVFSVCMGLAGTVVSKNLVDAVTGFNSGSIVMAFALYVGFGISQHLVTAFTGRISLLVSSKVSNEIRYDIFDRVMYTEWETMAEYSTGDLLVRTTADAGSIANCVLSFIPHAVTAVFNFAGAFIIVCCNDPVMALIALAGAPVTFLTSRYRMSRMREHQKENQKMASERMAFNQETFQNVQSIKAFGLIERFSCRLKDLQKKSLDIALRQYKYQAKTSLLIAFTGMAVSYSCYGFAVYRLWQGAISYGTMLLFVSLAGRLTGSFSTVVGLIPTAVRAATSAERIMEIIDKPREAAEDCGKARELLEKSENTGLHLEMNNLSFTYRNGKEVFRNASFESHPGEIVALIGPSGQGKTTALRLLLGLVNYRSGELNVYAHENEVLKISPATRCLFSYVPQGNTMFSGTVAENLRLVKPEATDDELREALEAACAMEFVSRLEGGINAVVGERGQGFSEGQNQRLSIARALLADAPVMLLDEATSALDVATEHKVLQQVIRRNPNKTIIVTAHRPSVISMCSRIYMIDNNTVNSVEDEDVERFYSIARNEEAL